MFFFFPEVKDRTLEEIDEMVRFTHPLESTLHRIQLTKHSSLTLDFTQDISENTFAMAKTEKVVTRLLVWMAKRT